MDHLLDELILTITRFSEKAELEGKEPEDMLVIDKTLVLLNEEMCETIQAVHSIRTKYTSYTEHGKLAAFEELVDGFADAAFVAINGIYKTLRLMGVDTFNASVITEDILWRVACANNSKLVDGKPLKDVYGKVKKPESFVAPQYKDLLKKYIVDGLTKKVNP